MHFGYPVEGSGRDLIFKLCAVQNSGILLVDVSALMAYEHTAFMHH